MCLSPLSQVSPSLLSPLQPGITRQMCKLVWKLLVRFNYQEPLSSSTDQNTSGEIRVEYKQSEKKKKKKRGGGNHVTCVAKKNASRLQKCLSLYRTSQLINKWWWLAWQEQGHLEMFEWEREEGQIHSTRANETWALRFVWFQGYLRSPCPPSHIVGSLRLKKAHFNWKVVGGVIVGTVVLMWGQSCPDVVVKLKKKDNLYCIN